MPLFSGYTGERLGLREELHDVKVVWMGQNPRELSPARSLKLANHSPTGFDWGYGGSGPAQLALAILLDFTNNKELSLRLYQQFKSQFVARWGDKWRISEDELQTWINSNKVRPDLLAS